MFLEKYIFKTSFKKTMKVLNRKLLEGAPNFST